MVRFGHSSLKIGWLGHVYVFQQNVRLKKKVGYRIMTGQSVLLGVCFHQIQLFFVEGLLVRSCLCVSTKRKIKKKVGYRIMTGQSVFLGLYFYQIQLFFTEDRLVRSCLCVSFYKMF